MDSTIVLEELQFVEKSNRQHTLLKRILLGSSNDNVDITQLNLSQSLNNVSGVYIKNYGVSSISTSSIRGASASQSIVLWNDLPIHSPMLGLMDLSLIPISLFDEVSLIQESSSSSWGSGAIGGSIHLNNISDHKGFLDFGMYMGSFGRYKSNLSLKTSAAGLNFGIKANFEEQENDFSYYIDPALPKRSQTNAAKRVINIMPSIDYKMSDNSVFSILYWFQKGDREIPPNIVQSFSTARQEDESKRLLIRYDFDNGNNVFGTKSAYYSEKMLYLDSTQGIHSLNSFDSWIFDVDYKKKIRSGNYLLGFTGIYNEASSDSYTNDEDEVRLALFSKYRYLLRNISFELGLRQELIDKDFSPIIPSLSFIYGSKSLSFQMGISRNFRYPTINDRYWVPGGNLDILPEKGWSQEITFLIEESGWNIELDLYNRVIKNWVLWALEPDQFYYSAQNIGRVWSRGLNLDVKRTFKLGDLDFQLMGNYSFTKSTNEVKVMNPSIEKGDQLWYVPLHSFSLGFVMEFKRIKCQYSHQNVGEVMGLNGMVNEYSIADFLINFKINVVNNMTSKLFFGLYNLWNSDYIVVERIPMPGRNIEAGLRIEF